MVSVYSMGNFKICCSHWKRFPSPCPFRGSFHSHWELMWTTAMMGTIKFNSIKTEIVHLDLSSHNCDNECAARHHQDYLLFLVIPLLLTEIHPYTIATTLKCMPVTSKQESLYYHTNIHVSLKLRCLQLRVAKKFQDRKVSFVLRNLLCWIYGNCGSDFKFEIP